MGRDDPRVELRRPGEHWHRCQCQRRAALKLTWAWVIWPVVSFGIPIGAVSGFPYGVPEFPFERTPFSDALLLPMAPSYSVHTIINLIKLRRSSRPTSDSGSG
jgi:hypothetical protein